ncbi:ABC transporter permease [Sciscionella marina]|uniref:ABC transporter permease n=1 Tax=Sciscionella marina TaxID=508770 RepID=UPI0003A9B91E|nr:ABC transporter permease [Sciscionella marina]
MHPTARLSSPRSPIDGLAYPARVTLVTARRELGRLMRARVRLLAGMVQPMIILFALGAGLNAAVRTTPEGTPYRLYVTAGAAVTALTTTCMNSALSIVGDRQSGFLRSMLVSPASAFALLFGRTLGVSLIGTAQVLVVALLAIPLGVSVSVGGLALTALAGAVCAFAISGIGSLIAAALDRQDSVNAVNQLVLLPLIFLSGGMYALDSAPLALRVAGFADPLRYAVDVLRYCFVGIAPPHWLPGEIGLTLAADCLVMAAAGIAALLAASVLLRNERH